MEDEKKLFINNLDYCKDLPKEEPETTVSGVLVDGRILVNRSRRDLCLGALLFTCFVLSVGLVAISFRNSTGDFLKYKTTFQGGNDQLVNQEVVASVTQNFIEYYVTVSRDERVTVIDDFNQKVQIMKMSSPTEEVCYVAEMKEGSLVRPSDAVFGSQDKKSHVSQVYEASEQPLDDLTVLGVRGRDLCRDVAVYWIRPMSETDNPISASNFNVSTSGVQSRSKRNISQCHTSCCWLVCCCNVHHFTWERAEHFTCNHVCRGCSAKYRSVIRKLC